MQKIITTFPRLAGSAMGAKLALHIALALQIALAATATA